MSDRVAVEFANEAFYVAFAAGDVKAMEELWARAVPVTCIHPGWAPLFGRADVMESWGAILTGSGRPKIRVRNARVLLLGDVAYVVCHEVIERAFLIATNVFVREKGTWKMVHHQAGETPPPPEEPPEPRSTMQ